MKTKANLLVVLALSLAPAVALAQQDEPPRVVAHGPRVQPVPAPSTGYAESNGVAESEHETGPAPFKMWGTQFVKNEHPPYWAMLFNFALLLFIYWRYGRKPIAEALKNRKLSIADQIEKAQNMLREARQRSKRYHARLEKVEGTADAAIQNAIAVGKGEAEMLLRGADEKAARIKRDAEFMLDQEKKQTQIDLLRETIEKATKEAEDLLRKNVSTLDQERLAEEFIAQLSKDYDKGLPVGGAS